MAFTEAISNGSGGSGLQAPRSNATRSGAFNRARVCVAFQGVQRLGVIAGTLDLQFELGQAGEASFEFRGGSGYVPTRGHAVVIGHGTVDNRLFSGRVTRTTRTGVRAADGRPIYRVSAVDRTWDLTQGIADGIWDPSLGVVTIPSSLTPSQYIRRLFAGASVLPTYVSDAFQAQATYSAWPEPMSTKLDAVAEMVGAQWYVDQRHHLHFFGRDAADPQLLPTINTLTLASGAFVVSQQTDLSRVVTTAIVMGGQTTILEPVHSRDVDVPVQGIEGLYDPTIEQGDPQGEGGWGLIPEVEILLGGQARSLLVAKPLRVFTGQPRLLAPAPVSMTANSFYVIQFAGSDQGPYSRWWTLAGTRFYASSVTTFSTSVTSVTVNTVYSNAFVPGVGVGAPFVVPPQAIPAGTLIEATNAELVLNRDDNLDDAPWVTLPPGTPVRTRYIVSNLAAVNAVSSLMGTYPSYLSTVVDDPSLDGRDGLFHAASLALIEGHPSNHISYTVQSRDQDLRLGQTVHLAINSLAEPNGLPMTGSYRITELHIAGFDDLARRFGPMREATLAPVKSPNYFRILASLDAARKKAS